LELEVVMEIEAPSRIRIRVVYRLSFDRVGGQAEVIRFRCDREGHIEDGGLSMASRDRLRNCLESGEFNPPWIEEVTKAVFAGGGVPCDCDPPSHRRINQPEPFVEDV